MFRFWINYNSTDDLHTSTLDKISQNYALLFCRVYFIDEIFISECLQGFDICDVPGSFNGNNTIIQVIDIYLIRKSKKMKQIQSIL